MLGKAPRCRRAPRYWQCLHPLGHGGQCRTKPQLFGRVRYALFRIRVWPWRMLRKVMRKIAASHTRCPSCGRRETPLVIEPCRHCGFFSPF